jgi:hypothetical protein
VVNGDGAAPLVTVILPTHDHASTLDLAVDSVLRQSLDAIEVVIIGDGVGDDTRDVISTLVSDPRVRFLDMPKSPSRAELARHEILSAARASYACYMGDDDLMLPDHVESTVERLQSVDFTHPFPAFVGRDGALDFFLTDISDPRCLAWHMQPRQNSVSLTGAGHRLDAYRTLPHGWREPPPGTWSDHYMWQQWFETPSMRFSTGDRVTVLKFYADTRQDMTSEERRKELTDWLEKSAQPDFETSLAVELGTVVHRLALRLSFDLESESGQLADAQNALEVRRTELEESRATSEARAADAAAQLAEVAALAAALSAELEDFRTRARDLQRMLDAVHATRTWRLHDLLAHRSVRGRLTTR